MTSYAEALAELCQAKLPDFVAERKRLSKELKAAGDSAGAGVLPCIKTAAVSGG